MLRVCLHVVCHCFGYVVPSVASAVFVRTPVALWRAFWRFCCRKRCAAAPPREGRWIMVVSGVRDDAGAIGTEIPTTVPNCANTTTVMMMSEPTAAADSVGTHLLHPRQQEQKQQQQQGPHNDTSPSSSSGVGGSAAAFNSLDFFGFARNKKSATKREHFFSDEQYPYPLYSGHFHTIFGSFRPEFDYTSVMQYEREHVKSSFDGCDLVLEWCYSRTTAREAPRGVVAIIPGLASTCNSNYVQRFVLEAVQNGFHTVVIETRGIAHPQTVGTRMTCGGFTEDIRFVIEEHLTAAFLEKKFRGCVASSSSLLPPIKLLAIGFSMGGTMLCSHLGKMREQTHLHAAFAACSPFDFVASSLEMRRRFNMLVYQPNLTKGLTRLVGRMGPGLIAFADKVIAAEAVVDAATPPLSPSSSPPTVSKGVVGERPDNTLMPTDAETVAKHAAALRHNIIVMSRAEGCDVSHIAGHEESLVYTPNGTTTCRTLRDFDALITAPAHNFGSPEAYYTAACPFQWLHKVEVPLLCFAALDDPITGSPPPLRRWRRVAEVNPNLLYVRAPTGGHLGFVKGPMAEAEEGWCSSNSNNTQSDSCSSSSSYLESRLVRALVHAAGQPCRTAHVRRNVPDVLLTADIV